MDMLTKIITSILLVITSVKLCYSEYASTKLSIAPSYPSYNIIEPDGPGTYAFGYEIDDAASGNKQFRNEERLRNGTVQGSYGSVLPDGTISITKYVADENGYRSKIENKQPRPIGENVLDNHQRPSSSASPEISPDLAALILSQKKPGKPIQPTKMEDLEPRGITDELSDDSLAEVLYDFRSKNHRSDEESDDDDDDEEDDDGDWERDDGIDEAWEDDSDYDHVKYVKEVGEWKEVEHREYEDDDFEEFEEDQWVEDSQDGKWAEVEEEVEDEGADEDEWEEFENDDDDEDEYNIGDGSEDEDWEEWSEQR